MGKGTGRLGNKRTSEDHPDYSIGQNKSTQIGQNKSTQIKNSPQWEEKQLYGRLKRLISDISHEKT